tara:strand:- start:1440 stop:1613 length:174 start_codon:yes stop_codon:yes gene_type:complete
MMEVGDLVRLRPEHNDVGWLDIIFIITKEDKQTGMVEVSTTDLTFPVPKRFLEVVYG